MDLEGVKILDIGCGTGKILSLYKNLSHEKENLLYGIDISQNMIRIAKTKASDVKFVRANALTLPFKDGSFDFISMIGVLEYLKEKKVALGEIYRVLENNGKALVSFSQKNILNIPRFLWGIRFYMYDEKDIIKQIEDAGFKVIEKRSSPIQTQLLCQKI